MEDIQLGDMAAVGKAVVLGTAVVLGMVVVLDMAVVWGRLDPEDKAAVLGTAPASLQGGMAELEQLEHLGLEKKDIIYSFTWQLPGTRSPNHMQAIIIGYHKYVHILIYRRKL